MSKVHQISGNFGVDGLANIGRKIKHDVMNMKVMEVVRLLSVFVDALSAF